MDDELVAFEALNATQKLHLLRGEYIEAVSTLDNTLAFCIRASFRIQVENTPRFHEVLACVGLSNKIELVASLFSKENVQAKSFLREIRRANALRNSMAHGTLFPDWDEGQIETTLRLMNTQTRRSGHSSDEMSVETMQADLKWVAFCDRFLFVLGDHLYSKGMDGLDDLDWHGLIVNAVDENDVMRMSKEAFDSTPTIGPADDDPEPADA